MASKSQKSKVLPAQAGKCQNGRLKFKILFVFFFFFVSHITYHISHPAFAADEFAVAYDTTYEIQPNGSAKVVSDIALTNKLSNVYATEYNLVIEKGGATNIGAWDSQGEIKTKLEEQNGQIKINLKFNEQVVGVDKTLRFTLKYEQEGLAKKTGQIWQVILPQQTDLQKLVDYRLTLKVPKSFPTLSLISPLPSQETTTNNFYQYSFSKKILQQKGIVAVFGQSQVFDFRLTYHLANPKREAVFTKIALPPTTSWQTISYFGLEPKPENVEVDEDGNWLAVYTLSPKEKKEVIAQGQVQIYAEPQPFFKQEDLGLEKYLVAQEFWEVNHPEIQKIVADLKTAEQIYNLTLQKLAYDFEKVKARQTRMGALKSLDQPQKAICMEFTDLFVTLARTAGIPARELNGFAYTDNPKLKPLSQEADILHSWPEYWDREKNLWIQVDPTWEKTSGIDYFHKFDLSHFVFAIHGLNSQYPAPAGSYKKEGQEQKDIEIDFGAFEGVKPSRLTAQFVLPKTYLVERGTTGKIILENLGPTAFYNLPVELSLEPQSLNIKALPPFGKREIPIRISGSWWPKTGESKVELFANNQNFSYNMMANSLVLNFIFPALGGIALGGSLLVFILKIRKK